jgi:hypothetical protein
VQLSCVSAQQTIEEQVKGTFDLFYLPIDFNNKCNVSFACTNMLAPEVRHTANEICNCRATQLSPGRLPYTHVPSI